MSQTRATTEQGTISERAMLVDLTINTWGARKSDSRGNAAVTAAYGSQERMGKFTKHLIDPDYLKSLKGIAAGAADEHRRRTLPWLDSGARILSSAGYLEYAAAMRRYESQWIDELLKFVAAYPDYVLEARAALNGLFNPGEYPPVSAIDRRFSFGYNVLPMPAADDFRVNLGDVETERIRRRMDGQIRAAVEDAMRDVASRIRDEVGHMVDRLRAYTVTADGVSGAFRDTLVANVKALVDVLPSLNITGDAALTAITERMRTELLACTAQTLRDSQEQRDRTANAAESILADVGALFA